MNGEDKLIVRTIVAQLAYNLEGLSTVNFIELNNNPNLSPNDIWYICNHEWELAQLGGIWYSSIARHHVCFWTANRVVKIPLKMLALELEVQLDSQNEFEQFRSYMELKAGFAQHISKDYKPKFLYHFATWKARDWLKLLQRVNLNMREKPFIEKCKWSKDKALLFLSDEGRIEIEHIVPLLRICLLVDSHVDFKLSNSFEKFEAIIESTERGTKFQLDQHFSPEELNFCSKLMILYALI